MASSIFARIGTIKGESRDARHKDEIDVLSWAWGLSQAGNLGHGGGGGSGKVSFQDLTFTHHLDKSSPSLMKACATGTHLKEASPTRGTPRSRVSASRSRRSTSSTSRRSRMAHSMSACTSRTT
ncbi:MULTISPECIES: type VI secretion system tube protein Hcp [unclassified Phycicoccus]|uniref:Hcp family type VI secretion system effector n=1 Tax=unclassified Phycicoccus TaxID=2637926 RepID=UPI000A953CC6|nr:MULTISPECIES: type VI secretion system tube protein Hcp [unclassified Phycicoccus]